ncbi:hypothetical protein BpHYR1_031410 [Brachionus plicatilis]|uniref:Uncharacterized protein n=1 Tax=Brachionus plicatilis TaxID=10195 RepID=A0A3M7S782_BRAPC|nr:hypothetical protein BpHYR1_031410 [Brachionus plicatilis]
MGQIAKANSQVFARRYTKAQCKEFWTKEDGWHDFYELLEWSRKFFVVKVDSENWESSKSSCNYKKKLQMQAHNQNFAFFEPKQIPGFRLSD